MAPSKADLSAPPLAGSPFSFSSPPSSQPSTLKYQTFSFSNALDSSLPATANGEMGHDGNDIANDALGDEDDVDILYLEPAAWPKNGKAKWKVTGRTMMAAVNSVGGEVSAWMAKRVSRSPVRVLS